MTLEIFLVHLAVAGVTFLLLNWIGMHSAALGYISLSMFMRRDEAPAFNFIYRALGPVVVITLAAAVFTLLGLPDYVKNLWLAVVYYFMGRALFNVALGRAGLINWRRELALVGLSILGSWFIYEKFLRHPNTVLPDAQSMVNEFWLLIVLFIYTTLNGVRVGEAGTKARKQAFLERSYTACKARYQGIVETIVPDKMTESLVYAILLVENFNRPGVARVIERLVHPWGSKSLGPLQVTSDVPITDEDSIRLGTERIVRTFETVRAKANEIVAGKGKVLDTYKNQYHRRYIAHHVAAEYNRDQDYVSGVIEMHDMVVETFYPQLVIPKAIGHPVEYYLNI